MSGQYLTAVFEMRPSKRKAAVMERCRSTAEAVFWSFLSGRRNEADRIATMDKARKQEVLVLIKPMLRDAKAAGLNEPVITGLMRDAKMTVSSYIELKIKGHDLTEWPEPARVQEELFDEGIRMALAAITREEENAARDTLSTARRVPVPRPLTIARSRDGELRRHGQTGRLSVVLNIVPSNAPDARPATMAEGINPTTGEIQKAGTSKSKILVPLNCSRWHENTFLKSGVTHRSSLVVRKGARWFLLAQFEMPETKNETETFLGIDRGIANTIAMAVIRADGSLVSAPVLSGGEVTGTIREAECQGRRYQRRTGRTRPLHRRKVDHILHGIANRIVAKAKEHRAQVVLEKLDGLKETIRTPRQKGRRKGGCRKSLKKAQLAKLEELLIYKLRLHGLPVPKSVPAAGTSVTCSACGYQDRKNRTSQESFKCVSCGHADHADANAAIQIARRGAMKPKKGDKLHDLHKNMVTALQRRDDGGPGPRSAPADRGVVAARASA